MRATSGMVVGLLLAMTLTSCSSEEEAQELATGACRDFSAGLFDLAVNGAAEAADKDESFDRLAERFEAVDDWANDPGFGTLQDATGRQSLALDDFYSAIRACDAGINEDTLEAARALYIEAVLQK